MINTKVTIEDEARITEFYIPKDSIETVEELLKLYATGAQNTPKQATRLPGTIKESS